VGEQQLRAIVVEDQKEILELMVEALASKGVHVRGFLCPKEALEAIKTAPPDVVITDIQMPEMDGIEFIKLLKKKLPVVMVTSSPNYDTFDEIMNHCDAFIDKVDMGGTRLFTAMNKAIERSSNRKKIARAS